MSNNDNYNYNTYIDNWALIEFCKVNNIDPKVLNATIVILLSWLIKLQINAENFVYKDFEDGRYILVHNEFIKQNVHFISTSKSMVHEHFKKLIAYKFIRTENVEYNTRYVIVNPELINLWSNKNYTTTVSPTDHVNNYRPEVLNDFREKYNEFINEDWTVILSQFNLSYSRNNQPMKVNSIVKHLRLYLEKSASNDVNGIHKNQRFKG